MRTFLLAANRPACFPALMMIFFCTMAARGQDSSARKGTVEQVTVHGKGLEHNLSGDSPDREVSVYLPPGYKTSGSKRYPVVYFLHGFTDNNRQWYGITKHWINLPEVVNHAFRNPQVQEMIIVTPDAYTRFQGSMYSNSITTGDWENYIAKELVDYVDSHYRTIANASARGLAGHSMGGYGTMRIGEKHPEIFSSIYLLSPCCMMPDVNPSPNPQTVMKIAAVKTPADLEKADFGIKAAFASAAAWSPNPKKPPFFIDLPTDTGSNQRLIAAKWAANMPLAMADQYIPNLNLLHAIAFDAGNDDKTIAASIRVLDEMLNNYNIKHDFEVYQGNHINKISERIENKMLQFFSNNLKFEK